MRPQFAVSLVLAVLLNPLTAASGAESSRYEVATRTVKFGDLDLNSPKDVATLYSRLKAAASQVCEPADSRAVDTFIRLRHCKEQAIDQAVAAVNSSQLLSFHLARIDAPVIR